MKKILFPIAYLIILFSYAQNPETQIEVFDRSKAPESGPAPEIKIGSYESFVLPNGLEVFVVEDKESNRISMQLSFSKHDPIAEGSDAGIGNITAELLENGTKNRSATQIEDEIDYIGANVTSYNGGIFASSLKKYEDNLVAIMSDILLNPSFPEEKLTKIKKRSMSNLLANVDDPNAIAGKVIRNANYGADHAYGEESTATTISNIDRQKCIDYYNKYYKPNAGYLVIVGNIGLEEAKELASKNFSDWEKGEISKSNGLENVSTPSKDRVLLVDRPDSKQSVINITYPVTELKPGTDEAMTASVMNSILGGGSARLFNNLREDKGYTYGAYSSLRSDKFVGSFSASASVRNEVTEEAIFEFLSEMNRMVTEKVPEDELQFTINKVAGSFARSLENPQAVANFAINTARYNLPEDYYQTYLQRLRSITSDDIYTSAKKFIRPENANIIVVGDGEDIRENISKFGEIVEYTKEGSKIEKVDISNISIDDVNPEDIIANYIKAIGGSDKVRKIESIIISCSSPSGEFNMARKGQKAANSLISGDKMVFQTKYDGKEASINTQNGSQTMDLATIKKMKYASRLHEEVFYGDRDWNFKLKLKDVEEVNGKACYKVLVTAPSTDRMTKYYDIESGLLIQEKSSFKGTITYENYKSVNGVLFPHKITIEKSPIYGSFSAVVNKIDVNIEVSDLFFKIF